MLKINIENLNFSCIIGILDFERLNEQKVIVNLSFKYDFEGEKDIFIDYSEVALFVENSMIKEQFKLIEDAILYLKNHLKSKYKIKKLKIKISKPDIMKNCIVSVGN